MLRPEVSLARRLRRRMTLPEVLLWRQLRACRAGMKVRRQHPLGRYVADFCVLDARLVIEVDGAAHDSGDRPMRDDRRDGFLQENGYRVMRVAARDVQRDVGAVFAAIVARVAGPLHHSPSASGPPPRSGEE